MISSNTFIVLSSMLDSAKCLDDNLRNELCYVIMEYGFNGKLVECNPIVKAIMMSIMPNIDSSKARYKTSVENGKKGGRPKTQTKPNHNPDLTQQEPRPNPDLTQAKPNPNLDKDKDKDVDKDVDKDKDKKKLPIAINADAFSIADYLHKKILAHKPNFKQPNLNSWAKDINLAMRIDKRTVEELRGCIDWIYTDKGSFWIPNIMSGKKLREKFDTMESQMIKNKSVVDDIYSTGLSANELINEAIKRQGEQNEY